MREIFKSQMDEFHGYAYTVYLAGEDFLPMKGDQFFLFNKDNGDGRDGLLSKSVREKAFFEWNSNGWWQQMSDEDIPESLL